MDEQTPISMPAGAACRTCGYSLHALVEPRCPECGTVFVPDDERTFHCGKSRRSYVEWGICLGALATLVPVVIAYTAGAPAVLMGPLPVLFAERNLICSASLLGLLLLPLGAVFVKPCITTSVVYALVFLLWLALGGFLQMVFAV